MRPPHILLIEDTDALRTMLAAHLQERGFTVTAAATAAAARAAATTLPDAAVLDIGLPDGDGLDLLPALAPAPVLILTARDDVESRVAGLDAGADDYLTKPFAPPELEARLRALLRRPGLRAAAEITCFDLTLALPTRTLHCGDTHAELSQREATILRHLATAAGRVVVRDALADPEPLSPNAIEAIISRLRRKLTTIGSNTRLESVRGIGYRLLG